MRTELLCALVLLGGAEVALAQAYPSGYYYPGYGSGYVTPVAYYPYPGYGQTQNYGYYYPSYGYAGYYPAAGYQNYYQAYPQYASYARLGAAPPAPEAINNMPQEAAKPGATPPAKLPAGSGPAGQAAASPPKAAAPAQPAGPPAPGLFSTMYSRLCSSLFDTAPTGPFRQDVHDRFWVSTDYTLSWFKAARLPGPLVTTGAPLDAIPGAVGQPGTADLVGNSLRFETLSGMRFEAGLYLDDDNCYSVDVGGMYILPRHLKFRADSDNAGNPVIARPFFDVARNMEQSERNSFPAAFPNGAFAPSFGSSVVDAKTELYGFEVNARVHSTSASRLRAEGLFGFRHVHLGEDLTIRDQVTFLPLGTTLPFFNNQVNGLGLTDLDSFQTSNAFYGLQLGGSLRWDQGWFFAKAFGKLALGANQEKVDIIGSTTFNTATGQVTVPGGILALPSNSGAFRRTIFGVVPEVGLTLGADLTTWLRLTAGYSFLYWNAVVRPGTEIDRVANSTAIPGDSGFGNPALPSTARPLFTFNNETFWVHSLTCGLDFHY